MLLKKNGSTVLAEGPWAAVLAGAAPGTRPWPLSLFVKSSLAWGFDKTEGRQLASTLQ